MLIPPQACRTAHKFKMARHELSILHGKSVYLPVFLMSAGGATIHPDAQLGWVYLLIGLPTGSVSPSTVQLLHSGSISLAWTMKRADLLVSLLSSRLLSNSLQTVSRVTIEHRNLTMHSSVEMLV